VKVVFGFLATKLRNYCSKQHLQFLKERTPVFFFENAVEHFVVCELNLPDSKFCPAFCKSE